MKRPVPRASTTTPVKCFSLMDRCALKNLKYCYCLALVSIFILLISRTTSLAHEDIPAGSLQGTIGKVEFPISCGPTSQSKFNHGVALLHNMMYAQANEEFTSIAGRDPDCAMAYWGISMSYLHPLWAKPSEEDLTKGLAAIKMARALNAPTKRERAYIEATEAFYNDWKTVDHAARIKAWETAQKRVHKTFPEDIDAAALYSLSHLATAPKDDKTYSHQKKAGALMEELLSRAPEHPGLYHYTIHSYDNPMLASRAVKVARTYNKLAPDVPHALHMPTHIFVRLGLWPEVIDWNIRSAAVAREQSIEGKSSLHYIHAMDYLIYAYLQQGQDKLAKDALKKINRVKDYQDSFASAYGIAAAQARYPLEQKEWIDAAKLEVRTHATFPWDKYPWHESIIYFARGLGSARSGNISSAKKAIETLNAFYKLTIDTGNDYWAVLVDSQRNTVAAWIALAEGNKKEALKTMRKAANLEDSVDKHPVTPGAVLPAQELLGDMLIILERPAEALKAYETTLRTSPNRLNSLYGAGSAAELA
ncbi:MAG: hypothetical protein V3V95_07290, partial [Thermodesulfobacteriota bacterium]